MFALLQCTKNSSASGSLGIGWDLLKQGWSHIEDTLMAIFNACVTFGYHPHSWKSAVVVTLVRSVTRLGQMSMTRWRSGIPNSDKVFDKYTWATSMG